MTAEIRAGPGDPGVCGGLENRPGQRSNVAKIGTPVRFKMEFYSYSRLDRWTCCEPRTPVRIPIG